MAHSVRTVDTPPVRLSVIIPVRDDPRLDACLDSLARQTIEPRAFEVIVVGEVAGAAERGAAERGAAERGAAERGAAERGAAERGAAERGAAERGGGRSLVAQGGAYAARVAGVAAARGEVLAFTDSDVVLPRDWLATIDALFADPTCEVVTGPSSSSSTTRIATWIQAIDEGRWTRAAAARDHAIVETRNLAARAAILRQVTFDPAFRNAGDLDLGIRLRSAGFSIRIVEAMRVVHGHPESLAVLVRREIRRGRGLAQLDRKHGRIERSLGERPLRIGGIDVKAGLLSLARRPRWRWIPAAVAAAGIAALLPATWLLARLPGAAGLGQPVFNALERSSLLFGRSRGPG